MSVTRQLTRCGTGHLLCTFYFINFRPTSSQFLTLSQFGPIVLGIRLRSRFPSSAMMPQPGPGAPSNPQGQPPLQQYPQQSMAAPPPPTQHQQWMMMMQQQQHPAQPVHPPTGWTPQPVPPPVPAQMQQYPAAPYSAGEIKSLWIGDLQPHMDETYLVSCFAPTGEVLN